MIDPHMYDLVLQAMRALFLLCLPIVVCVSIAGTIMSLFQSATSIQELASGYGTRLLALIVALYFFLPSFARTLVALAEQAFH